MTPSTLSLALLGSHTLTRAKLRREHGEARLTGTLNPAEGGEDVLVSDRSPGGQWHHHTVLAASSGAFSLNLAGIRGTTEFVAQWTGEGNVAGAGTPALRLTVKGK